MAGEHAGHRQRMKQRFQTQGLEGFAPHEMLELALFYAIPQRDVNPLAHRLIERYGSLHGVLDASVEELQQVDGIGENAATLLALFSHMARALERSRDRDLEDLNTHRAMKEHCYRLLCGLNHEEFYVVCLNAQNRLIRDVCISKGSVAEVWVHPREVVDAVLRHNASAVVLCHNHPSGSVVPSANDLSLTRKVADVLTGIGVPLHDHLVVGGSYLLSMLDYDLMKTEMTPGGLVNRVADSETETRIRCKLVKKFGNIGEKMR